MVHCPTMSYQFSRSVNVSWLLWNPVSGDQTSTHWGRNICPHSRQRNHCTICKVTWTSSRAKQVKKGWWMKMDEDGWSTCGWAHWSRVRLTSTLTWSGLRHFASEKGHLRSTSATSCRAGIMADESPPVQHGGHQARPLLFTSFRCQSAIRNGK